MYIINESKLDKLISECDNVSRKLLFDNTVPIADLKAFSQALLAMQTEVRSQQAPGEAEVRRLYGAQA